MDYSFGNWVKRRRKTLDLTQPELAQRVGCSVATIVKIESDERRPSRQIAELLSQHLQIPADQREQFLLVARQEKNVDWMEEPPGPEQPPKHQVHPIPSPGPLLGREFERTELTRLIQDPHCRLLTLTGPGGIGKTHLVTHLTSSLLDSHKNQAGFVALAPVTGREQTVTAIADALGIVLYAASDRANQLMTYLQDKNLILILDNFEHLATDAACVDLIQDILRSARHVKILITSRQPLQLQAEWVFEVQGLPVPKTQSLEDLGSSSAVSLFIRRANQVAVGFKPTHEDLKAIADICGLVEGLPLGIELAAGWIRIISCEAIAQEIRSSLDFLKTSGRDLPERHRSMRATIEHSWKLLTVEEQKVLPRLAVFRGGFTRQGAEFVAGATLTDLLSLVSKSLIRRANSGRYDMHELVYQYALEKLAEDSALHNQIQEKHSHYYAALLDQRGPALKGADRAGVVAELISDLANVRQAWQWAASHQQTADISRSADTLFWLYESRSNCREGVPLYGKAVEGLQLTNAVPGEWQLALGQALCYQGFFLFRQGQHPQGRDALKASLTVLSQVRDSEIREYQMALSNTVIFLGTVISAMGDFGEGDRLLREGLQMKQTLGDPWGCAFAQRQIGLSAHYRGDYAASSEALEQSLKIGRNLGNSWAIAASLNQLGIVAHAQGQYEQAHNYLQEGLELSRSLEDRFSIASALDGLGLVSAARGKHEEAKELFRASISLSTEIGEQGRLAQTLIHYGEFLLETGNRPEARENFLEALSMASRAEITPTLLEALLGEAEIRAVEGDSRSACGIAWSVTRQPSGSHATLSRAEKLCAEMQTCLPPEEVNAVHVKYEALDTLVAELLQ